MLRISYWAKRNPRKTWAIIVFLHILLTNLAIFLGLRLFDRGTMLSPDLLYGAILLLFLATFLYPEKKKRTSLNFLSSYYRQKSCDFVLVAATFLMVTVLSNRHAEDFPLLYSSYASNIRPAESGKPTAAEIISSLSYRDKSTLTRAEKRILKQELKKQLKRYAKATITGKKDEAGDAGVIILVIVAAVGLTILLGLLACEISCSGAEGLAVAVFIVGLAAIIWGSIAIVNSVRKKRMKRRESGTTRRRRSSLEPALAMEPAREAVR